MIQYSTDLAHHRAKALTTLHITQRKYQCKRHSISQGQGTVHTLHIKGPNTRATANTHHIAKISFYRYHNVQSQGTHSADIAYHRAKIITQDTSHITAEIFRLQILHCTEPVLSQCRYNSAQSQDTIQASRFTEPRYSRYRHYSEPKQKLSLYLNIAASKIL
jgi:hypothetical protein